MFKKKLKIFLNYNRRLSHDFIWWFKKEYLCILYFDPFLGCFNGVVGVPFYHPAYKKDYKLLCPYHDIYNLISFSGFGVIAGNDVNKQFLPDAFSKHIINGLIPKDIIKGDQTQYWFVGFRCNNKFDYERIVIAEGEKEKKMISTIKYFKNYIYEVNNLFKFIKFMENKNEEIK